MLGNIGPMELFIVLLIVIVLFGAKRLPQLGSSLGQGIRGFKRGLEGPESPGNPEIAPGSGLPEDVRIARRAPEL